eukprot:gene19198-22949_t
MGCVSRASIQTLVGQRHAEDPGYEQDCLEYLEQIHHNIPGAVFHLSVPKSEAPCSVHCVHCSNGSFEAFGIPSSRLTHPSCNFLDVFASIIEPSYQQDFLDRFEDMRKNSISLEWKGMLRFSPSLPVSPKWIHIQIQPITYSYQGASGSPVSASLSLQDYVGYAWDCSAEQEAQKLNIEEALRTSDLQFALLGRRGEFLALVGLVQEELCRTSSLKEVVPSEDYGPRRFDNSGNELLESLLDDLRQVCQQLLKAENICMPSHSKFMRKLLDPISSEGSYQQQLCIMTGKEIVDHYARAYSIDISPSFDAEAGCARIQFDSLLFDVVLSNLLTNALTHGSQEVKPRINVKLRMADASNLRPSVAIELWNAPGLNHAHFSEHSADEILQSRGPSAAQHFPGDGMGMLTIKMCLQCTAWTMGHEVKSNGTTMRIHLPGALVTSQQAAGANTVDSSLLSSIPSGAAGDELIQSPLSLCFLSESLERSFWMHKREQCPPPRQVGWRLAMIAIMLLLDYTVSSSLVGLDIMHNSALSAGVITLTVLHAAASVATLTVHEGPYFSGGAATCEDDLEAYSMVVMWLSQGTVLLCGGNLPREQ